MVHLCCYVWELREKEIEELLREKGDDE